MFWLNFKAMNYGGSFFVFTSHNFFFFKETCLKKKKLWKDIFEKKKLWKEENIKMALGSYNVSGQHDFWRLFKRWHPLCEYEENWSSRATILKCIFHTPLLFLSHVCCCWTILMGFFDHTYMGNWVTQWNIKFSMTNKRKISKNHVKKLR